MNLADTNRVVVYDPINSTEVLSPLNRLAQQATDTLIVYYAGHGLMSRTGELILATSEANPDVPSTGVPYSALRDIVSRARAARRIVILDCCFSGRAIAAMSDTASAVIGQIDVQGTYVLTSAPATSPSLAPPGERYTAFTGGLLDILRNGIPGGAELITLNEIYQQVMALMARKGWPRPQRLGTNSVGELGILHNPAADSMGFAAATTAEPPLDVELAAGIIDACGIAASIFVNGSDEEDALFDTPAHGEKLEPNAVGFDLVRETAASVRDQYGDGGLASALMLGEFVRAWDRHQGESPLAADPGEVIEVEVAKVCAALTSAETDEVIRRAVRAALGGDDLVDDIVAAAVSVGPSNVQVVPATAATSSPNADSFVIETFILAPNSVPPPIVLDNPMIVVSAEGELDTRALVKAVGTQRQALLLITPRLAVSSMRELLHSFSEIVVVRPRRPDLDLTTLSLRFAMHDLRAGWGRARRALVLSDVTTIDNPATDLSLSRNRITLEIVDPWVDRRMPRAVRALAVARSALDDGLVESPARSLRDAALAIEYSDPRTRDLVCAVAAAPFRLLQTRQATAPPTSWSDGSFMPLVTIRGALQHATASAGRYFAARTPR